MSRVARVTFEFADADSVEQAFDQMLDIKEWAESIGVRLVHGYVEEKTTLGLPGYYEGKAGEQ